MFIKYFWKALSRYKVGFYFLSLSLSLSLSLIPFWMFSFDMLLALLDNTFVFSKFEYGWHPLWYLLDFSSYELLKTEDIPLKVWETGKTRQAENKLELLKRHLKSKQLRTEEFKVVTGVVRCISRFLLYFTYHCCSMQNNNQVNLWRLKHMMYQYLHDQTWAD
jgi:hypothetical protein